MKKYHFNILVLAVFMFVSYSCKKKIVDYRNKYTGDYNFVYAYSSWTRNSGFVDSDTVNYSGKVYYDKKSEGTIKIEFNTNSTLELLIAKNGDLSLPCGEKIGQFDSKKKLTIAYSNSSCPGGGLGGGINNSIKGTKKK